MITAMMQSARRVIVLADAAKFGATVLAHIAPLARVHVLVTDANPPPSCRPRSTRPRSRSSSQADRRGHRRAGADPPRVRSSADGGAAASPGEVAVVAARAAIYARPSRLRLIAELQRLDGPQIH